MMMYLINRVIKEAIDLFKVICNFGNKGKMLIIWKRDCSCKVPSNPNQSKDREKDNLGFGLEIRCEWGWVVELV